MVTGSLVIGKLLDRDYASFKERMIKKIKRDGETGMLVEDVTKEENFPIELARLRTMPVYLAIFCIATIGYGWTLQERVSIAVPLLLHICSECFHVVLFLCTPESAFLSGFCTDSCNEHEPNASRGSHAGARILHHSMRVYPSLSFIPHCTDKSAT